MGRSNPDAGAADLHFQQLSESTVRIGVGTRAVEVAMVVFRQEEIWTGEPFVD
jgi:hypothetical protein